MMHDGWIMADGRGDDTDDDDGGDDDGDDGDDDGDGGDDDDGDGEDGDDDFKLEEDQTAREIRLQLRNNSWSSSLSH